MNKRQKKKQWRKMIKREDHSFSVHGLETLRKWNDLLSPVPKHQPFNVTEGLPGYDPIII